MFNRANTLGYLGAKPGCFGQTRVCTRYQTWLFWSNSGMYPVPNLVVLVKLGYVPGTNPGCFGQLGYVPGPGRFGHTRLCTRVPNLVVLVILGYVPGYLQSVYQYPTGRPKVFCSRITCFVYGLYKRVLMLCGNHCTCYNTRATT